MQKICRLMSSVSLSMAHELTAWVDAKCQRVNKQQRQNFMHKKVTKSASGRFPVPWPLLSKVEHARTCKMVFWQLPVFPRHFLLLVPSHAVIQCIPELSQSDQLFSDWEKCDKLNAKLCFVDDRQLTSLLKLKSRYACWLVIMLWILWLCTVRCTDQFIGGLWICTLAIKYYWLIISDGGSYNRPDGAGELEGSHAGLVLGITLALMAATACTAAILYRRRHRGKKSTYITFGNPSYSREHLPANDFTLDSPLTLSSNGYTVLA